MVGNGECPGRQSNILLGIISSFDADYSIQRLVFLSAAWEDEDMPANVLKTRFYRPKSLEVAVRVRPVFDDFHVLRMQGAYEYPRHTHSNYEIILVDRGPYHCELNGSELTLTQGEILLIKPGDWHQDHLRNGQKHYVIHFHLAEHNPIGLGATLFSPGIEPASQVVRGDHLGNAILVRELQKEALGGENYGGAVQDCLLEALFWRLVRSLEPKVLSPSFRRLPQVELLRERLLKFADEAAEQRISVAQFAHAMKCSVRGLSSACRTALAKSPAQVLLEARVQKAEELLRFGHHTSKEVSDRLGFANPFHFSRVFKRVRGETPSSIAHGSSRPPALSGNATSSRICSDLEVGDHGSAGHQNLDQAPSQQIAERTDTKHRPIGGLGVREEVIG